MMNLTFTGSRVSGPGYGYAIVQSRVDASQYGVVLSWAGLHRLVWSGTWSQASDQGQDFCRMGQAWFVYTSRQQALTNGIAVIGGV